MTPSPPPSDLAGFWKGSYASGDKGFAMFRNHHIQVLPSGPALAPLMSKRAVLHWCLCATGQAFCSEPPPLPAELSDPNIVEPFGGSLLHLALRPSLKIIDDLAGGSSEIAERQFLMISLLAETFSDSNNKWVNSVYLRDLFGYSALDYVVNQDVLKGQPFERSVIAQNTNGQKANFRGIILSLTKTQMLVSDLYSSLRRVREIAGLDLYPGVPSANPAELRQLLLRYFDKLNHATHAETQV